MPVIDVILEENKFKLVSKEDYLLGGIQIKNISPLAFVTVKVPVY